MYALFKDFSTPSVTLLVGAVALFIQVSFNKRQLVIAEDKLKFDLFERRYAIYKDVREFLDLLAREPGKLAFNSDKIRSFYIALDEAAFFFKEDVRAFLREIHDGVEKVVDKVVHRHHAPEETRASFAEPLAQDEARLRNLYGEMIQRFGAALKFKQLT
jgi:hypothetical protein